MENRDLSQTYQWPQALAQHQYENTLRHQCLRTLHVASKSSVLAFHLQEEFEDDQPSKGMMRKSTSRHFDLPILPSPLQPKSTIVLLSLHLHRLWNNGNIVSKLEPGLQYGQPAECVEIVPATPLPVDQLSEPWPETVAPILLVSESLQLHAFDWEGRNKTHAPGSHTTTNPPRRSPACEYLNPNPAKVSLWKALLEFRQTSDTQLLSQLLVSTIWVELNLLCFLWSLQQTPRHCRNLLSQLMGRCKDHSTYCTLSVRKFHESLKNGQQESEGFPRAGLSTDQHIPATES